MIAEKPYKEYEELLDEVKKTLLTAEITKKEKIQALATKLDKIEWSPRDTICRKICDDLRGYATKQYIRKCLDDEYKRPYDIEESEKETSFLLDNDLKKTIEVSSTGEQDVFTPPPAAANPMPEPDESIHNNNVTFDPFDDAIQTGNEQIGILQKELEDKDLRLNEAFSLIEDKDKRIQELELQQANIEVELGQLKKKDPILLDRIEIENQRLRAENEQLHEVEAIHTRQQDFKPASSSLPVKQIWIAAINALNLFIPLRLARDKAINENTPWRKLIFEIAEDGQVKGATLEPEQNI